MRRLKELGHRVIIHTARPNSSEHLGRLVAYLEEHGIAFDGINSDPESPWLCDKPLADLYIDDRALHFFGDWKDILWQIAGGEWTSVVDEYRALLGLLGDRAEQGRALDGFLSKETNWLTAPASTRFHLAEEGGLLHHSVNVARTMIRLRRELMPSISIESCIIVALFHDTGKVGYGGIPYYIKNTERRLASSRGKKYIINPRCLHIDLPTRSLFIVSKYMDLTPEEAQAIRYHDGQYIDENRSVAHREAPLTRLLQYADNWSGGVIEARGAFEPTV